MRPRVSPHAPHTRGEQTHLFRRWGLFDLGNGRFGGLLRILVGSGAFPTFGRFRLGWFDDFVELFLDLVFFFVGGFDFLCARFRGFLGCCFDLWLFFYA